jgi:hypothetical protein
MKGVESEMAACETEIILEEITPLFEVVHERAQMISIWLCVCIN